MEYNVIDNPQALASANRQIIQVLRAGAERGRNHPISFRPTTAHETVYWNENLGFWFADVARQDHDWRPFGVVAPASTAALRITVEINTPRIGIHQRAGLILRGSDNRLYLAHTGRVGGGATGIGQEAFLLAYGIKRREVIGYDDGKTAIRIGALADPRLVERVGRFVHEVAAFRSNRTPAPTIALPPQEDRPFTARFIGNVTYEAKSRVQAKLMHDLVVSTLSERLSGNCRQTSRQDLFLRDADGKVSVVYEIKTDCSTTSLYTGVGQLLLNGFAEPKAPRLVLVIPCQPDSMTTGVLSRLNIEVLTYRWVDGRPIFPGNSASL